MTNGFDEMILNMTDTTPEPEDYTGEDGLLYCGKCHKRWTSCSMRIFGIRKHPVC